MENQTLANQSQLNMQQLDDEINLMDLLLVIAKHNRFIVKLTLLAAILAIGVALLLPNIYTAKSVILPPQQGSSTASMLLGQLGGGLGDPVGGVLGVKNPNDFHIGMLKSRTIADTLVKRFKLQTLFEAKTLTAAREVLVGSTTITSGKDSFITIEFSSKDPKFAAEIANAYVEELDKLNQTLAVTGASRRRVFFENQLTVTKDNLANAEISLKETQERTGLIALDKQGGAIIDVVANLRAQVAAKEVELVAMRAYATEQNPDYRQVREVIAGLKVQLAKVERNNVAGQGDVMVPTGKVPALGLEYIRKVRDVKYQENLFELFSKQYEMARIDEAKDSALIQVVDKALPPEKKAKPKRALIVVLSTMLAFFIGILLAFFREAYARSGQDPEASKNMKLLFRYLKKGNQV